MELTDAEKRALVEALENGGITTSFHDDNRGLADPHRAGHDWIWKLTAAGTLLAQALRSLLPRPMEEAPRDGTEVLLGLDYGARVVGKWNEKHEIWNEPGSVHFAMEQHCVCWWPLPPLPEKST